MPVDQKILELIPEGCRVNWNATNKRYYVFKSKYVYDPSKKRGKEIRTQVGVVVDGKFQFSKSYLLKQQVKELKETAAKAAEKSSARTGKQTAAETKPVPDGVKEVLDSASKVKDSRQQSKVVYPLDYVYLVSLLASLSGQTSCVQIADFWASSRPALEELFDDFPRENISHDTVRRLLMLIDPAEFASFYKRLVTPLLDRYLSRVVAVDGQAVRASRTDKAASGRFVLTFYDTENGVALCQKVVGEKENEITHAASMVEGLDLSGCVVTADAMNTQRSFAKSLVEAGADYCLAVKENQKSLWFDIRMAFLDVTETRARSWTGDTALEHGRLERRSVRVLPGSVLGPAQCGHWIGLEEGCIIAAVTESTDKKTGRESSQERYFITTLRWDSRLIAEQAARAVRRHWGVENELHYVLDVDFQQDRTQCKNANYLYNRVLLNKFAVGVLNKLQNEESKESAAEPTSKKRWMNKLHSAQAALAALARVYQAAIHA
mgnify:CR=1 FL=1